MYNGLIVSFLLNFGYNISFKNIDRGFIELLGPYGISKIINNLSFKSTRIQTGQITHYTFFVVAGLCLLLLLVPFYTFLDNLIDIRLIAFCFCALITAWSSKDTLI